MVEVDIISHTVGEKPTSPLMFEGDKWAYIIDSIEQEEAPEGCTETCWKFHISEKVPITEYVRRQEDKIAYLQGVCNEQDEALAELYEKVDN